MTRVQLCLLIASSPCCILAPSRLIVVPFGSEHFMTRSGVAASAPLERQQNIVPIRTAILKALALTTSSPVVCRERRTYRAVRLPTDRPQHPSCSPAPHPPPGPAPDGRVAKSGFVR